jgi:hypothetical protein
MLAFVGCVTRTIFVATLLTVFYTPPADTGKRPSFFFIRQGVSPIKSHFRLDFLAWSGKTRSLDFESVLPVYRNMTHPEFKDVSC